MAPPAAPPGCAEVGSRSGGVAIPVARGGRRAMMRPSSSEPAMDPLALLHSRRPDGPLPGPLYGTPEAHAADLAGIWTQEWLLAAPSAALAEPGAYVTMQVGPYPVLAIRGRDGVARAFHNVCRHRGSRLCGEASGRTGRVVCPYHRWAYDLDGRLLWAKDMGEGFDRAGHGLLPVHCREGGGLVWVCLAAEAPDLAPLLAATARYAAPHRMEEMKVAHVSTIVERCDWKLTLENNRECYHCGANHPSLCRTFDEDPELVGSEDAEAAPAGRAHVERCEAAGLPSRYLLGPQGQWRLVRIPLVPGAVSYTLDGAAAVRGGIPGMPFPDAGTLLLFHYPNSWNHFLSDHTLHFRVLPRGPGETEVTTWWLVHRDAREGEDYDLGRLTEVWEATNAEDRHVVEETQRGVASPAFRPGPYSVRQEGGVRQFVDWYAGAMLRHAGGPRRLAAE